MANTVVYVLVISTIDIAILDIDCSTLIVSIVVYVLVTIVLVISPEETLIAPPQ